MKVHLVLKQINDSLKNPHQLFKKTNKVKTLLTLQGDGGPGLPWVHESRVGDLLPDVLFLVEGERAAQAHVHDDAHGPHVQGAVVAVAADHLRGQVGWRPHDGATERLLAYDAGEAEVAELHLQRSVVTVV